MAYVLYPITVPSLADCCIEFLDCRDDYLGIALQPFYEFVRIVRTVHSPRLKCFILRLGLRVEVVAVYDKHHLVHIIQFGNELCGLE